MSVCPGVSNVNFVCGRAEDVMQDIRLPASSYGKVVGIVDPPRAGLRESTVGQPVTVEPLIEKRTNLSTNESLYTNTK